MSTFRCPVCAKENPEQAKFCLYCGIALEAGAERVCPQCGTHLPAHARFCFACGVSLDASSSVVGMKHGSLALPQAVERLMGDAILAFSVRRSHTRTIPNAPAAPRWTSSPTHGNTLLACSVNAVSRALTCELASTPAWLSWARSVLIGEWNTLRVRCSSSSPCSRRSSRAFSLRNRT